MTRDTTAANLRRDLIATLEVASPCPTCHAATGAPCVVTTGTRTGQRAQAIHADRTHYAATVSNLIGAIERDAQARAHTLAHNQAIRALARVGAHHSQPDGHTITTTDLLEALARLAEAPR